METKIKLTNEQKFKAKVSDLEHKIYQSKLKDHQRINNLGWGYGMRCVKMPSFTRTDNLERRLKELKSSYQTYTP